MTRVLTARVVMARVVMTDGQTNRDRYYALCILVGDGRTDRWMDRQMDRWTDGWTDRWTDGQMDIHTEADMMYYISWSGMDGQTDGRTYRAKYFCLFDCLTIILFSKMIKLA